MPAALVAHALAACLVTSAPAQAKPTAPGTTKNPPAVVVVPLLGPVLLPLTLPTEVRVRRAPARPAPPRAAAPERPAPPEPPREGTP